jgi:hypothetical protein
MYFKYVLKSREDGEDISYDVFFDSWDEKGIGLQLNFSDPTRISNGKYEDKVFIQIHNTDLFVSAKNGLKLDPLSAISIESVPRQAPFEIDEVGL